MRAIDQVTALRLLKALDRHMKSEAGDVKALEGFEPLLFRLRVGDWRLIFRKEGDQGIVIVRVRHRREAYR